MSTAKKQTMSRFDRFLVAILLGVALVYLSGGRR